MGLDILSGQLSLGQRGSPTIGTSTVRRFSVSGRAVEMTLPITASLDDGDLLVVVGRQRGDVLFGTAMRNETTGARYAHSSAPHYLASGLLLLAGVPFTFVGMGLPLIAAGIVLLIVGRVVSRAGARLDATPAEQSVTTAL
jgi:uncharacterized membrane protein YecN with MAPEG domain